MIKKMLTAIACGLILSGSSFAATSAFRSLALKGADASTTIVNIEDEMNVKFVEDSMFVSTPEYVLAFAKADVRSWTFSTEWNPIPVIPPEEPEPPTPPTPEFEPLGDGSWEAPYNTLALKDATDTEKIWITGFIVGSFSGSSVNNTNFTESGHLTSNVILAPAPEVTDLDLCVPVRFTGADAAEVRDSLNLRDNPANMGREVSIRGLIGDVAGAVGMNTTTHFQWGNVGYDAKDTDAIGDIAAQEAQWTHTPATIDFTGLAAGSTVRLYNAKGQLLRSLRGEGSLSISLTNLPAGIYILNVNGRTAKISVSR